MSAYKRPELLAPAGTLDAIKAVLESGADAVYVSGKALNMRQHRGSYNFTDAELAEAVAYCHDQGKKLYFTLNSLVFDDQLCQIRDVLTMVGEVRPDALIVQDLAAATLAREICVHVPLHASTMMNVHNAETALVLKRMGFTRIITSRDIPLDQIQLIGDRAGLEVECFVHGDMCIAQGAQCYLSGITFGESSNCGRCMKPCRWDWSLKAVAGQVTFDQADTGYLLARKDLCLLQHVPALIQHKVSSLKIEGRMRTAEFLAPVVGLYRKAIDAYCDNPAHYALSAAHMDEMLKKRVREYTTSHMFGHPGLDGVDISGQREPRFFSESGPKVRLTTGKDLATAAVTRVPEIIAHVSGPSAARAAFKAGADAVYLNGDGLIGRPHDVTYETLEALADQAYADSKRLVVLLPAICDVRDMTEWSAQIEQLGDLDHVGVGVSNLGALHLARDFRIRDIVANVGLNVANRVAADELSTLGVSRVTASVEMDFEQLTGLLGHVRLPMDVIVQGPMPGMLMEHCVLATASGTTPQGICPMPCRRGHYVMEDVSGQVYPLICDRRCRNHLYTATDVCVLPNLVRVLGAGVTHLRIEAPFDAPAVVETVVGVYRKAVDQVVQGQPLEAEALMDRVTQATGRPLSDGPFDFKACIRRKERDTAHA